VRGRGSTGRQMLCRRRGAEGPPSHPSSCSAQRRSMKLEPESRRRPLSSTGAGRVEARSRCAHRSSTRAGPCDAVIDVVRSRRLRSGARLLLLPALGLLRALLRCLRHLPSLLRHAALLAVSEWRCRNSARGDREHCLRITTARQKCQHFRITARARRHDDRNVASQLTPASRTRATRQRWLKRAARIPASVQKCR
jgi:hypothetical protein